MTFISLIQEDLNLTKRVNLQPSVMCPHWDIYNYFDKWNLNTLANI